MKADREGGRPLDLNVTKLDKNGFTAKQIFGENYFVPPCLYYGYFTLGGGQSTSKTSSGGTKDVGSLYGYTSLCSSSVIFLPYVFSLMQEILPPVPPKRKAFHILLCIPVSPGKSRLIFSSPRNFAVWIERIFPRWIFHINQNLILDSDLYLLHVEVNSKSYFLYPTAAAIHCIC